MMKSESFNEKFVNVITSIFACGSSEFKNLEDGRKLVDEMESENFNSNLKRNSIHFSMMLDHLQNL
jgi:hypothetical protein